MDAVTYFLAGVGPAPDADDAVPLGIRELGGEQEAVGGPDALAEPFDTARLPGSRGGCRPCRPTGPS